ncbi:hypothetical protein TAL182_PC00020 (plasmid) [Rhizobium sp. TAL182]|nr:hypothetical protein TAL182_PC00020 [Rhizobium sp. TAL182]
MLVVSRLSAEFRSILYAIFLARNENTMATRLALTLAFAAPAIKESWLKRMSTSR